MPLTILVWTEEDRLEHQCRMGLMAIMILHWIVFALLVGNTSWTDASASDVVSNLASLLRTFSSC